MKKAIVIVSYVLLGAVLVFGVLTANWAHYKFGSSSLEEETKKVEVDVFDLPDDITPKPNRDYYKKVVVTTSIKAGTFPFLIKEIQTDTVMSDNTAAIFSDEKQK